MRGRRRRVLVVEDHPEAAELVRILLDERGHEVRVIHDGVEALEAVRAFRPDVILLDLSLPGLPGDEVAARIRAEHGGGAPRLVALSGMSCEGWCERCPPGRFDAVATKPDGLEELEAFLEAQVGA